MSVRLTHRLSNEIASHVAKGLSFADIADKIDDVPSAQWLDDKILTNKDFKAHIELVQSLAESFSVSEVQTIYHEEMGIKIAERVARGESFKSIEKLPNYPSATVIRKWVATSPEFDRMMWDARREAAQQMADEMCSIADNMELDPQSRRVMIDTRKFIAKSLIVQYNDKVTLAGDAENPLELLFGNISGKTLGPPGKR